MSKINILEKIIEIKTKLKFFNEMEVYDWRMISLCQEEIGDGDAIKIILIF